VSQKAALVSFASECETGYPIIKNVEIV